MKNINNPLLKNQKKNEDCKQTAAEIIAKDTTSTKDFENSFKKPLENTEILEQEKEKSELPAPSSIVKAHSWSGTMNTFGSKSADHLASTSNQTIISNVSKQKDLENNSKLLTKAVSISASDASDIMPPPSLMATTSSSSTNIHRPKKSIFKSKSQSQDQKRKGLSLYKHSFGAKNEDKDEEELRRKVFQQKAMR